MPLANSKCLELLVSELNGGLLLGCLLFVGVHERLESLEYLLDFACTHRLHDAPVVLLQLLLSDPFREECPSCESLVLSYNRSLQFGQRHSRPHACEDLLEEALPVCLSGFLVLCTISTFQVVFERVPNLAL